MIRSKIGLLALCAFVFGLMAFSANGAQAAKWLILTSGGVVKTGEELPATVEGEIEKEDASLLTEILKIKTQILCKKGTLSGVKLEGSGKLTTGGKVKFEGCRTLLNGVENKECVPKSTGAPEGTVETNKGKGLLVLREGVGETKVEPETGTTFATLLMKESCPIGESVPIIGVLFLKDCEGKLETHLVKHLIEEGPGTELWAISKTTEHVSKIDGSALVFLGGAHVNLAWDGMAE